MLKVLGIAGSPRRGGNTDLLLNEVLKGAASQGAEVKTIILSDLNIAPCKHCDGCLKEGNCIIKDDMQDIYTDFEEADVIVMATPIQFMGMTAPMKAMIDRFQSRWARKYVRKIPPLGEIKKRKGFFIAVGGTKYKNIFDSPLIIVKTFFLLMDIEYAGDILLKEIDEIGAINDHPEALQQAYEAGQELVEN